MTKEFYTPEEALAVEKRAADREAEQTEPGTVADVHYDFTQFGLDRSQSTFARSLRTSLIVDPPDGKIPPVTAEGQKRAAERAAARKTLGGQYDAVENMPIGSRCIIMAGAGPPMMNAGYNSQLPDRAGPWRRDDPHRDDPRRARHPARRPAGAAARRPPVDGRLARALGRQHAGRRDDELQRQERVPRRQREHESHRAVHPRRRRPDHLPVHGRRRRDLGEALDRGDADGRRPTGPIFEFACHEANYGIANILAGARADEKRAAEAAAKKGSN